MPGPLIGKGEETISSDRERIDQQNTDKQDHGRYKDRHGRRDRCRQDRPRILTRPACEVLRVSR